MNGKTGYALDNVGVTKGDDEDLAGKKSATPSGCGSF